MNVWEKLILALTATAAQDAPLFVHSSQGILITNASENLLANLITAFRPAAAPSPATVSVAAPVVPITAQSSQAAS